MKRTIYTLLFSLILLIGLSSMDQTATATTYSVGLESSHIRITSPQTSGIGCHGSVSISGKSDLPTVWFCVRGPQGDLSGAQAEVAGGSFTTDINLRLGEGEYTVWAGDNAERFDGSIRFLVENQGAQDTRYTSASCYVDSDNPEIIQLADSLAPSGLDDMEKLRNIHDWITNNISFDCNAYISNDNTLHSASQVLKTRTGMCRDYAFLLAALSRAAGLQARVIYGEAVSGGSSSKCLHAWNEVQINGKWVPVDSCWDAGYVQDNSFVFAPSTKFLAPDMNVLAVTHTNSSPTLD
ncbi:MAG TPA: transglutaminase-like domain-containing protein [Syntrophomonadaceae bacterium]|nr:transglutaminase-like domain-containing protein [Syntrophomonadaceae bacterium]